MRIQFIWGQFSVANDDHHVSNIMGSIYIHMWMEVSAWIIREADVALWTEKRSCNRWPFINGPLCGESAGSGYGRLGKSHNILPMQICPNRTEHQFNWLSWWITTTQKDTNAVDRKHNKEKWPLHFLSFHSHDCYMGCIRFSLSHRRIRNWTNAPMHVHEENEKTHIYMTMWHTQTNWIEPKISHLLVRECDKLCTAISKNIILNTFVRDQSCK